MCLRVFVYAFVCMCGIDLMQQASVGLTSPRRGSEDSREIDITRSLVYEDPLSSDDWDLILKVSLCL